MSVLSRPFHASFIEFIVWNLDIFFILKAHAVSPGCTFAELIPALWVIGLALAYGSTIFREAITFLRSRPACINKRLCCLVVPAFWISSAQCVRAFAWSWFGWSWAFDEKIFFTYKCLFSDPFYVCAFSRPWQWSEFACVSCFSCIFLLVHAFFFVFCS